MSDYHFYEPAHGHGLAHDPTNAIVAPRPIGWISTVDGGGVRNLAPYSFFNMFNYRPPIIGFTSNGWKDSVANVAETKEFVWNLATHDLMESVNASSARVAANIDEFDLTALQGAPSRLVKPDRVAASKVQFECRLTQLVRLVTKEGAPVDSWMVLGEVVGVHIASDLIEDGIYQTVKARPVLRGGGPSDWFEIGEKLSLRRPD